MSDAVAGTMPRKWIVVLNYNVAAHCIRQIETLASLADTGLFLVDNDSAEADWRELEAAAAARGAAIVDVHACRDRPAALDAAAGHVRAGRALVLFRNEANVGYSGGNNTALRLLHAILGPQGAYLVINPDLVITAESARALLDSDAQIAGPAIFQHYMQRIDTTGHAIDFATGFVSEALRHTGRVGMLHGCCIKWSGAALERFGFLPDENFLYEEELRYFERVHRLGGVPVYLEHVRVEHVGKASVRKLSHEYFYYIFRNKLVYFREIAGPVYRRRLRFLVLYLGWCWSAIYPQLRKRNWSGATGVVHGVWDGLRGAKGPLKARPAVDRGT